MRPQISVVLCAYNCALVGMQIESILAQNEPPDELVVIDDSTDDGSTWAIIQDVLRDSSIERKVVKNSQNIGMRASYEKALRLSTCEIVATCDHDDLWMPSKLRVVRDVFASGAVAGAVHDVLLFEGEGRPSTVGTSRLSEEFGWRSHRKSDGRAVPLNILLRKNRFSGTAMAFRRELLDDLLPFPESVFPDYWIALVSSAKGGLHWIDEPLVRYRRYSGNTVDLGPDLRQATRNMHRPFAGIGSAPLVRLARMSTGSAREFHQKATYEDWRNAVRSRSNRIRTLYKLMRHPQAIAHYPSFRSVIGDLYRLAPFRTPG